MKQATPHEQLIGELLDSTIPKTEREHAAAREIERIQELLAANPLDRFIMQNLPDIVRQLQDRRDHMYDDMLLWRGIDREGGDTPCKECAGSGVRAYGNTTTWRGGIGGQMITSDICDKCWGSGNAEKPWMNLRRLSR